MMIVLVILAITAALALLSWEWRIANGLRKFRVDLMEGQSIFEGKSIFVQRNVMNANNYRPEALPILRRLRWIAFMRVLASFGATAAIFFFLVGLQR